VEIIDLFTPENIESVSDITFSEIEPLYWSLEDSMYDNKFKTAKSIFNMLCCISKHKKALLFSVLSADKIKRIKQIGCEIYSGQSLVEQNFVEIKLPTSSKELLFKKEAELRDYIYNNPEVLFDIDKKITKVRKEVKVEGGYSCDLTAESDIFYAIELKLKQSTHSVVSQIDKYCFYFYRTLRYDHYKRVQGVTIANGYDVWSINELRRNGILVYDVIQTDSGIKLQSFN